MELSMISNKTKAAAIAGTGLAAILALATSIYNKPTEEQVPIIVKSPEECAAEATAHARIASQGIKLQPGQSIITLTDVPSVQDAAKGLAECIETYANSQEKSGFNIGRPAPVSP